MRIHGRTRAALAALPMAAVLVLAGCGGSDGAEDGVASANDSGSGSSSGSGSGGSGGGTDLGPDEMAQKFAECMRENGVDMADPKPGEGLDLDLGAVDRATADKALKACRQYDPMENGGTAEVSKETEEKLRAYSQCMRENGVDDFPDPVPGGGLEMDGSLQDDPDFQRADETCRGLLPGGGKAELTPKDTP
ncbi:hypothetical protein ABZX40_21225 [Streptomyces sp. NPDC004610]|uniref:hypothetical protein n=1 Tax=unclassified Streptomyces TaxID=2593676 RepID=UPI0033A8A708